MSFLLSRNPVWAAVRALIGLGLLGYGLVGFNALNSGTAGAITPSAYLALPQCPGNPVPTSGACYSVRPGTVVSSRQQLTTYWVTISDGRTGREIELANGNRFATFQPNTAIAVKYWRASVTAVGVPIAGDASALTSTVDSPLGHNDALVHSVRYMLAGLVGVVLGVLPLLLQLGRRSSRRPAYGAVAEGSAALAVTHEPALYSPPVPVEAAAGARPDPTGAASASVLSSGSSPPASPALPPGSPNLRPVPALASDLTFVVSSAPGLTAAGPSGAPPVHDHAPSGGPPAGGPGAPPSQPVFTVLGAAPGGVAASHPRPMASPSTPTAGAPPGGPQVAGLVKGDRAGTDPPRSSQPRWTHTPAASVHFPAPVVPPRELATMPPRGPITTSGVPLAVVPRAAGHGEPAGSGPIPQAMRTTPAALPAPIFSVLHQSSEQPNAVPPGNPAAAPPGAVAMAQPPPPATSESSGGPGWAVRQGPGPGPRQAG